MQVQGSGSTQVSYVVRKRSSESTEQAARKEFEQLRITASKLGDVVVLEGRAVSRNVTRMAADFVVQIPRLTQTVKAETKDGALSLTSIQGFVTGSTGGGAVKLDDIGGPTQVTSGGGAMNAGNIGADLFWRAVEAWSQWSASPASSTFGTGGGKVRIGTSGPAMIETGAGNIEVGKCNGELHANSGGGNLNLGEVAGNVTAETGGGSVRLSSAQGNVKVNTGGGTVELWKLGQGATVETGGGAITVQFIGGRGQFRDSYLHTALGNVVVYLPRDLGVSVHASTEMANGAGIKSAFPGVAISSEGGQYGPKSMFGEGALMAAAPILRVRRTIGQIDIRQNQ